VYFLLLLAPWMPTGSCVAEDVTPHVTVTGGAVNQVVIKQGGSNLAVYQASDGSDASAERLLLTHHRRDVTSAAHSVTPATKIIGPQSERALIEEPQAFWDAFTTARFHDYAQQSTKILSEPLSVARWVKEGDVIRWKGIEFRVLNTPGYTRGSVSYVASIDDRKIAFTGDLIYGDGKIFDLYSFQDAISEANIRGYHGYGGRLAALVASLQKIAEQDPALIIPARGPVIREPQAAIQNLTHRVRSLYHNYLSTNALHWYFKEERMRTCGERVLGAGADIELMPYSLHQTTPDWVFEHATSRLLISDDGHGFLLDCGYQRVIDAVKKLITMGLVQQVDGIFVTHYHDDHTDMVQAAAEEFDCPVYATGQYADVLENPGAYHLPAMTPNVIADVKEMKNGETMKWQEFDLTFHFFPGQTFYHGAVFVKRQQERPIFFIGDAFSPSGIDDYCVLNRNLVHADSGYQLCFQKLRQVNEEFWLVNEHIPYVFAFSDHEMDYLETRYRQRAQTLRELFPWDDPNYGIDEQWAVFYPYGVETGADETIELEVRITNHSPKRRTFQVTPHVASGMTLISHDNKITLPSRASGKLNLLVTGPAKAGNYLVTADVQSEGMQFRNWIESLVTIKELGQ
jgi:glyoxylase-like metal-dependent hydrolase (beta-lactamase superfamily II)